MSFKRTNIGISNEYLFYNVDVIVLVEGGASYNKNEVYSGISSENSIDRVFWNKIFNEFDVSFNHKIKPVGSKNTIKLIADDINHGLINNVITAMDKEYDDVKEEMISNPYVLYTSGYSWENDVWNEEVIIEVIKEIVAHDKFNQNEIKDKYNEFIKKVKLGVYTDGYAMYKSCKAFFPRNSLRFLRINNGVPPKFNSSEVNKSFNRRAFNKSTIYSFGSRKNINVKEKCYGHLFDGFCCHLIKYILNNIGFGNVRFKVIRRIAINKLFVVRPNKIMMYYNAQLTNIAI